MQNSLMRYAYHTIYGESKDHIAYVEFDIMTVGGKQYLGKDEEW